MQLLNEHDINWFKNTVINSWGLYYCKSIKYTQLNKISLNWLPHHSIEDELNAYLKLFCGLK